jgi:hypothetical protein
VCGGERERERERNMMEVKVEVKVKAENKAEMAMLRSVRIQALDPASWG